MPHDSPLLDAALGYAARGWRVFPLAPGSKLPLISKADGGHGCLDATTDSAVIRAWWGLHPDANVGIATGAESGLAVLDFDGPEGLEQLQSLALLLPPTVPIAVTPNGRHVYFAYTDGKVPNAVRVRPGTDIRGEGGYVVAPPSHTPEGHYLGELLGDPPPFPDAYLPRKPAPPPRRQPSREVIGGGHPYVEAALRNECEAVARSVQPGRNHQLNIAAFKLAQFIPRGGLEQSRLEQALQIAAEECGLTQEDGEVRVLNTIRSGISGGVRHPRSIPEREPPMATATVEQVHRNGGPPHDYHLTDLGNSERFADRHAGEFLYCYPWNEWVAWTGKRWERDHEGRATRAGIELVREMYGEAEKLSDSAARKALVDHARRCEGERRIVGMLALARADVRMVALPESFDSDATRNLLCVENGTLDLTSFELGPHRSQDRMMKLAGTRFDPEMHSDHWQRFVERVLPDPDVRAYVQMFAGYCLTGETGEQVFGVLQGPGANGKSTYLEVQRRVLGDYADKAEFETFLEGKQQHKGGARSDILALQGRRLVTAIEASGGRRLDVGVVQEITGQDAVTARGNYDRSETTFRPQLKLLLAVNHRPKVRRSTEALWRRLVEIPFEVVIPPAERDRGLLDRLCEPDELAGILNWAVAGCQAWRMARLKAPQAISEATQRYRETQSAVRGFLDDRAVLEPRAFTPSTVLRQAYREWCETNDELALDDKEFSAAMEDVGLQSSRQRMPGVQRTGTATRGWLGVRLLDLFSGVE